MWTLVIPNKSKNVQNKQKKHKSVDYTSYSGNPSSNYTATTGTNPKYS